MSRRLPVHDGFGNDNPEVGLTAEFGCVRTNFHALGSGPPVLLIHGSGPGVSAWANWRLNMPELAKGRRVIAPDCIGFGYTERPDGVRYDRQLWLRHLTDLLDGLRLERVDIVGNSFGGGLALALAAEHPERVRRLVLMGSIGIEFKMTAGLEAVWGYQPSIENMRALLDIFAFDRSLVSDELAERRYQASILAGAQEAFAAMFPPPRQESIRQFALDESRLAQLPHRTLVIHGREDRVIPPSNAQRLFGLIPNAELHMFGKCGHWTQIECADRFNSLVGAFLE